MIVVLLARVGVLRLVQFLLAQKGRGEIRIHQHEFERDPLAGETGNGVVELIPVGGGLASPREHKNFKKISTIPPRKLLDLRNFP